MDKVAGMATDGIKKGAEGLGDLLAAPLQKFDKGKKDDDKKETQSAAPIIINIINQAKGDEDKEKVSAAGGATASASASA